MSVVSVSAQDRVNRVNGQITAMGHELKNGLSWMMNSDGEWSSDKFDTTNRLVFFKFNYKNEENVYLLHIYTGIHYKYPNIKEDPSPYVVYNIYPFDKNDFLNITTSESTIKLNSLCHILYDVDCIAKQVNISSLKGKIEKELTTAILKGQESSILFSNQSVNIRLTDDGKCVRFSTPLAGKFSKYGYSEEHYTEVSLEDYNDFIWLLNCQ